MLARKPRRRLTKIRPGLIDKTLSKRIWVDDDDPGLVYDPAFKTEEAFDNDLDEEETGVDVQIGHEVDRSEGIEYFVGKEGKIKKRSVVLPGIRSAGGAESNGLASLIISPLLRRMFKNALVTYLREKPLAKQLVHTPKETIKTIAKIYEAYRVSQVHPRKLARAKVSDSAIPAQARSSSSLTLSCSGHSIRGDSARPCRRTERSSGVAALISL